MSYTPPSGGALSFELSDSTAYTPPASSALSFELAASGGGSGVVGYVTASGALSLTAYPPVRGAVAHKIPLGALTLTAYAPTYAKTRTNVIPLAALTFSTPLVGFSAKNTVSAAGGMTLTGQQPTYFMGRTQSIVQQGSLTLAPQHGITCTKTTVSSIATASLNLLAYPPTCRAVRSISSAGALTLTALALTGHKMRILNSIASQYACPDVTLSDSGSLVMAGQHGITQAYRTYRAIDVPCGLMFSVSAEIVGAYTGRVAAEKTSGYTLYGAIQKAVDGIFDIRNTTRIVRDVDSGYRFPIAAEVVGSYALKSAVTARNAIASDYRLIQSIAIRNSVESKYSYMQYVRSLVDSFFSRTLPLVREVSSYYDLAPKTKARASVVSIYSAPDAQVFSITQEPYVEYEGRRLSIEEAEVSCAEGDYAWTCTVVLTNVSDYALLRRDKPFDIIIGAERYSFIVDSKELDRNNPANYVMKLMGVSPSAKFTTPRMQSSTCAWTSSMKAADIAHELIPALSWNVIDWVIPAYRFSMQDTTAIEAVKVLASAIGAVLESDIDGSLYVRSLFPISVPNYDAATPAHVLLEETDILSVSESFVSSDNYNRLVITDVEQSLADSLEWIEDYAGATTGIVRAYLYPWRSGVRLLHTGSGTVSIAAPDLGMTQHEEVIEVFQGQASTQYPIHHVESIEYEAQNVGSLVFDIDSRSFTVGGPSFNSVIRVVYWTRSLDYRASLPEARPTQFLLESDQL